MGATETFDTSVSSHIDASQICCSLITIHRSFSPTTEALPTNGGYDDRYIQAHRYELLQRQAMDQSRWAWELLQNERLRADTTQHPRAGERIHDGQFGFRSLQLTRQREDVHRGHRCEGGVLPGSREHAEAEVACY